MNGQTYKKTSVIWTKVRMNIQTKTRSKKQTKVHTSGLVVKKEQNLNVCAKYTFYNIGWMDGSGLLKEYIYIPYL